MVYMICRIMVEGYLSDQSPELSGDPALDLLPSSCLVHRLSPDSLWPFFYVIKLNVPPQKSYNGYKEVYDNK